MKESSKIAVIFSYIVFSIIAIIVILPYLWVIGNSFSVSNEIGKYSGLNIHAFIPEHFTLDNYIMLFERSNLGRVLFNTVFVATAVTLVSLFLNSLAAYALARMEFKGKKVIFSVIVATIVVPFEVLLIPLFQTIRQMNLQDTYMGLIMPVAASAFGIFFLRQFFMEIPVALEEAALLDGAGRFTIYSSIMLPLLKSPLVTLGVLTFLQQWDNFLWAVTVINKQKLMLLQVAIAYMATKTEHIVDFGVVYSGVVISALPIIIIFLSIQKYYIQSIVSTGVKG